MYLEALASIVINFHSTQMPFLFSVLGPVKVLFFTPFYDSAVSITIAFHSFEVLYLPHYVSRDHLSIIQAKI
jgi:hypothetical protein